MLTELRDGRAFVLRPGMSSQVADVEQTHRSLSSPAKPHGHGFIAPTSVNCAGKRIPAFARTIVRPPIVAHSGLARDHDAGAPSIRLTVAAVGTTRVSRNPLAA